MARASKDFWFTEIDGGVRFHVGELARDLGTFSNAQQHIDLLGADVATDGAGLSGTVTQVNMGANLVGGRTDFYRITDVALDGEILTQTIAAFRAAPEGNQALLDVLTAPVNHVIGQTEYDEHRGFPSEAQLQTVALGDGNDIMTWRGGSTGRATLDGGAGDDILMLDVAVSSFVDLVLAEAQIGAATADISGFERIQSGTGHDILLGAATDDTLSSVGGRNDMAGRRGDDTLIGGANRDLLLGGKENDHLDGGLGFDTLRGGRGDDTLDGGEGLNVLKGGIGNDTFVFARDFRAEQIPSETVITDFTPGDDLIDLSSYAWFDSLDSVLARARDTELGVIIDLDDAALVLLRRTTLDDLAAEGFVFSDLVTT